MMEEDERYIETLHCIVEQEKINERIAEDGMSEALLERQIRLNSRRHEFDIVDRVETIYEDKENKREFVQ